MKVTISKLQISQAKECAARLDKYVRMIDMAIEMLGFAKHEAQYNQLPEVFKMEQRRDTEIIIADLKSMKQEAQDLALQKTERALELEQMRNDQLEKNETARRKHQNH